MSDEIEFFKLFKLGSKKYYQPRKRGSQSPKFSDPVKTEPEKFIKYLSHLRREKGLTQQQLAKELNTLQPYISFFENGHANPTLGFLGRYCQAIGVDISIRITKRR